tara:strand:+ start:224 stop:385 length:162 start_codon:yes stop_codon:yes gene_type:complete
MTKAHDERFNTPPAMGATDPKAYPKGKKPGDKGFIEALAKEGGFKFVDKTKKD